VALEEDLADRAQKGAAVLVDQVEEEINKAVGPGTSRDEVFAMIRKIAQLEEPDLPIAEATERVLHRHPGLMGSYYSAPDIYRKSAVPAPVAGTKAAIYAEIKAAAIKAYPAAKTPEQAIESYIRDFPTQYQRYQDAPAG
jgi:hypothetical protein